MSKSKEMQQRREAERMRLNAAFLSHDAASALHNFARRECAKTGTVSSYPANFVEFHDVAGDSQTARQSRSALGLDLDTMRRHLAKSVPLGNLTDPEMGSVTEYDSRFVSGTPYSIAINAQAA